MTRVAGRVMRRVSSGRPARSSGQVPCRVPSPLGDEAASPRRMPYSMSMGRTWLALLSAGVLFVVPGTAQAQVSVTIAPRARPSYESITANLARNDIQESLRDLGPDTLYKPGQPVDADVEATGQAACSPLPNWRFTLGRGYQTRAVSGTWGALSI